MKRVIILPLLAFAISVLINLQAQTAMFGHDPQHLGVYNSNSDSVISLTKKWEFKTNGMIFSSAVVVNGAIYFGSNDSCLYALDTLGVLKWKFKSNGKVCSSPAVKDTVVYFNNYGAMFYAVNTKTGKEIWSFKTDGESPRTGKGLNWCTPTDQIMNDHWDFYLSSPVISDTMIYFGSGSNVYAFNLTSHKMLWKYTASNVVHSSPAVYNNMIYFGCWDSKLYALNQLTGELVWSFQTGLDPSNHGMEGIQSSPSIIDTIVLIGSRDANIYAINAKTGKKIWAHGFNSSWMPSSFAIYNNSVYTGSSDVKNFYSLNLSNGEINYSVNTNNYTFGTPAIAGETAFIGAMNGTLFAIDIKSGKIKCRFNTNGRLLNPLNAVNSDGSLNNSAFSGLGSSDSDAAEWVRRVLTTGSILAAPVIDNNTVYFGSSDNYFYAVYDKGGSTSILLQKNNEHADIVYPNPFNNIINVKTESGNFISIINSVGTVVLKDKITSTFSQIDLSNLRNGIYLVIIDSKDKIYTKKIIKRD